MQTTRVIVLPYDSKWKTDFENIRKEIEDAAGDMLADTAIGIGQRCGFFPAGWGKLQHILTPAVFYGNFLSVCSVVSSAEYLAAVCKVNSFHHGFLPHRYFFRR